MKFHAFIALNWNAKFKFSFVYPGVVMSNSGVPSSSNQFFLYNKNTEELDSLDSKNARANIADGAYFSSAPTSWAARRIISASEAPASILQTARLPQNNVEDCFDSQLPFAHDISSHVVLPIYSQAVLSSSSISPRASSLNALSDEEIAGLDAQILNGLCFDERDKLSIRVINGLSTAALAGLHADTLNLLPFNTLNGLKACVLNGLAENELARLDAATLNILSLTEIGLVSARVINGLSNAALSDLHADTLNFLPSITLKGLKACVLNRLAEAELVDLDAKVLNNLSADAIHKLKPKVLNCLSAWQRTALNQHVVRNLSRVMIRRLSLEALKDIWEVPGYKRYSVRYHLTLRQKQEKADSD